MTTNLPCPSWCVEHSEADTGTPDHFLVHWGEGREAAGCSVRLSRTDVVRSGITPTSRPTSSIAPGSCAALTCWPGSEPT